MKLTASYEKTNEPFIVPEFNAGTMFSVVCVFKMPPEYGQGYAAADGIHVLNQENWSRSMSRYELIQMGVLKDDRGRRSTCHLTMGPFVLLGSAKESTEAGQNAMFVLSRQQTIFIIEPYVRMHLLNEESMKTMTRKFVVHR